MANSSSLAALVPSPLPPWSPPSLGGWRRDWDRRMKSALEVHARAWYAEVDSHQEQRQLHKSSAEHKTHDARSAVATCLADRGVSREQVRPQQLLKWLDGTPSHRRVAAAWKYYQTVVFAHTVDLREKYQAHDPNMFTRFTSRVTLAALFTNRMWMNIPSGTRLHLLQQPEMQPLLAETAATSSAPHSKVAPSTTTRDISGQVIQYQDMTREHVSSRLLREERVVRQRLREWVLVTWREVVSQESEAWAEAVRALRGRAYLPQTTEETRTHLRFATPESVTQRPRDLRNKFCAEWVPEWRQQNTYSKSREFIRTVLQQLKDAKQQHQHTLEDAQEDVVERYTRWYEARATQELCQVWAERIRRLINATANLDPVAAECWPLTTSHARQLWRAAREHWTSWGASLSRRALEARDAADKAWGPLSTWRQSMYSSAAAIDLTVFVESRLEALLQQWGGTTASTSTGKRRKLSEDAIHLRDVYARALRIDAIEADICVMGSFVAQLERDLQAKAHRETSALWQEFISASEGVHATLVELTQQQLSPIALPSVTPGPVQRPPPMVLAESMLTNWHRALVEFYKPWATHLRLLLSQAPSLNQGWVEDHQAVLELVEEADPQPWSFYADRCIGWQATLMWLHFVLDRQGDSAVQGSNGV